MPQGGTKRKELTRCRILAEIWVGETHSTGSIETPLEAIAAGGDLHSVLHFTHSMPGTRDVRISISSVTGSEEQQVLWSRVYSITVTSALSVVHSTAFNRAAIIPKSEISEPESLEAGTAEASWQTFISSTIKAVGPRPLTIVSMRYQSQVSDRCAYSHVIGNHEVSD